MVYVVMSGYLERWKTRGLTALAVVLLGVGLMAPRAALAAGPRIDITFEPGGSPGEQIIHVETDFGVIGSSACDVLCVFPDYAALHPWIVESDLESVYSDGTQVVYFVIDLPWPVGRHWSRLEVERFGDRTVAWQQIDGSFKKNHGTVVIRPEGGRTHLSYWAVIDVGVPAFAARPFQEQFVREFLQAVYDKAQRE
jgi:hypothetical protein